MKIRYTGPNPIRLKHKGSTMELKPGEEFSASKDLADSLKDTCRIVESRGQTPVFEFPEPKKPKADKPKAEKE